MSVVMARLLEISLYAAVIFAAIMIVRKLGRKKISPVLLSFLWLILLARLCIPFTVDSGLHLIQVPEDSLWAQQAVKDGRTQEFAGLGMGALPPNMGQDQAIQEEAAAWQDGGAELEMDAAAMAVLPPTGQQQTVAEDVAEAMFAQDSKTQVDANAPVQSPTMDSPYVATSGDMMRAMVLLLIWPAGMAVYAVVHILASRRLKRRMRGAYPQSVARFYHVLEQCKRELGIEQDIPVQFVAERSSPALTISPKPQLLFPARAVDTMRKEELYFACLHELTHYKRRDHIRALLWTILQGVYWFNPVLWLARPFFLEDMEKACDWSVAQRLNSKEKESYAQTLVHMASRSYHQELVMGMALGVGKNNIKQRIKSIYSGRSKAMGKVMSVMLAVVLVVGCFSTVLHPVVASAAPEQEADAGEPEISVGDIVEEKENSPTPTNRRAKRANIPKDASTAKRFTPIQAADIQVTIDEEKQSVSVDASAVRPQLHTLGAWGNQMANDGNENYRYNTWYAMSKLMGQVMEPGEQLSLNEVLGDTTAEQGWKSAPGIVDGAYEEEAGGGKDRVATALYNAALSAELEIVEWEAHTHPLSYAPGGLDATVANGAPDLVIKNNKDYPIVVGGQMGDEENPDLVMVELLGAEKKDYYLLPISELVSETQEEQPSNYKRVETEDLEAGLCLIQTVSRRGQTFDVYLQTYTDQTMEEKIGEPEYLYTHSYPAVGGVVEYGAGTTDEQIDEFLQAIEKDESYKSYTESASPYEVFMFGPAAE